MFSLVNASKTTIECTTATRTLARAIAVSCGEFSLLLACCNSLQRQRDAVSLLKEFSSTNIRQITLSPTSDTLYSTIVKNLDGKNPEALMIHGLESVIAINNLIASTNLMRDELRKKFDFPLVLWVNDEILRKLVWLAPDLKDWAASTIRFDVVNSHRSQQHQLSA
ncbi:hypothetical protein [Calothrix sp. PCC 6303]|uniref:hypothetical protein n=1 Tax=Calothrix sp. PCC 6303 TaxID=1170562 RepID=UPI0002A04AA5|nr:hypothetical protein [Calothrix sp. PCC 6303]AFZ01847.1 WD repeat-containing protein [Calothrix sp. PCC 6303]